jgi:hypothetical protein
MLKRRKEKTMALEAVTLTIKGESGAEVQILPRTHNDLLPDPVFAGNFDQQGSATVSIPRGYYVVLSPGCETELLHLETGPLVQTVQLKKVQT